MPSKKRKKSAPGPRKRAKATMPYIVRTTSRTIEELTREFPQVARDLGFVYVGEHHPKDFLLQHGEYVQGEFVIFEFTDAWQVRTMLRLMPAALCLSPARIAAVQTPQGTMLSAFGTKKLASILNPPSADSREIIKLVEDYENRVTALMDRLCRGRKSGRRKGS